MRSMEEDRHLIDSILAGDPRAWEKIVQRFSGMVWRILLGRFRVSQDDAADAFQEIFLALQKDDFSQIRRWQGKAPLDAYMAVVLSRLAQDVLRTMRRAKGPVVEEKTGGGGTSLRPDPPDPGPDALALQELAERRHAVETGSVLLLVEN
jgi:DNA-directed RNA polymerase specialized sigma24 family protein